MNKESIRADRETKLYALLQWLTNNLDGITRAAIIVRFEDGDEMGAEAGRKDDDEGVKPEERIQ